MNDGFEECDACDGTGMRSHDSGTIYWCTKCYGLKKLSWIERIFGKEPMTDIQLRKREDYAYIVLFPMLRKGKSIEELIRGNSFEEYWDKHGWRV